MDVQGKKHYTDLPEEIRKDFRTERQWAKSGFLPCDGVEGVELYSNLYRVSTFKYYHVTEVRKAKKQELEDYFAPERAHRRMMEKRRCELREKQAEDERNRECAERSKLQYNLEVARLAYGKLCNYMGSSCMKDHPPLIRRIVIDTETTGLDPSKDEILQVSILNADDGSVIYNKSLLRNPESIASTAFSGAL